MDNTAELVSVARAILEGRLDLVEGVRQLTKLRFSTLEPDLELFDVIRGVESETDDLPIGEDRKFWNSKALAEKDTIRDEYIARTRPAVLDACAKIVDRFGD